MTKQTRAKLKRGFVKAPLVYKVLAVNRISKEDLKVITKALVKVKTADDAQALVGMRSKWGYKPLSYQSDRVGVITYKGIEVSLMYKRVTLDLVPMPEDPVPEGTLENAEDVWLRHDLFGASARQQHKLLRDELDLAENEILLLEVELGAKDKQIESLSKHVKGMVAKALKEIMDKDVKRMTPDERLISDLVTKTITDNQKALKGRRK